jgi:alginate O-acetyltransferase complex protein AlgI
MIFSTPIFIFGFLPAFLLLYYLAPARLRSPVILMASAVFYGWWRMDFLALVLGMALGSYIAAQGAHRAQSAVQRRYWVTFGVVGNLAVLGYFKYTNFILGNADAIWQALGRGEITSPDIILPIGLSFLTFQCISYVIDVARGDAPPARNIWDFLAFSTLFPQLIAGPVLRYKDLADQFRQRTHSLALFVAGVRRFALGLGMKILIADSVAPMVDRLFALKAPTLAEAWLAAGAYSIQLFFDFAGYSAMAIGLGLMIGFRFIENFNAPYISQSVTEFWQRWHISLSTWLRDYLYIPLGGNRGGALRTYRNLLLTMVLGGIWHGANWTFVVWGVWHGGWMALERALGSKQGGVWARRLTPFGAWAFTLVVVMLGWVVFRAPDLGTAVRVYAGMFGQSGIALRGEVAMLCKPSEWLALMIGTLLALAPAVAATFKPMTRSTMTATAQVAATGRLATLSLLLAVVLVMQARSDSPFLYFQF